MLNVRKANGEAPGSFNPSGAVRGGAGGWGPGGAIQPSDLPLWGLRRPLACGRTPSGIQLPKKQRQRGPAMGPALRCGDVTELVPCVAQLQLCVCGGDTSPSRAQSQSAGAKNRSHR